MSQPREFHGFAFPDGRSTLDHPAMWKAFVKFLAGEDGEEITITAHRRRAKRSNKQNAGFHAMITPWAKDEGHSLAELKRDLLGEIFGWSEKTSPLSENRMPLIEHTSDLTVAQFMELIDRTLIIAAECGHVLEAPDEYTERKAKKLKKLAKVAA